MQHLKVSGAVRPLKWSLGVKWLKQAFSIGNSGVIFCHLRCLHDRRVPVCYGKDAVAKLSSMEPNDLVKVL